MELQMERTKMTWQNISYTSTNESAGRSFVVVVAQNSIFNTSTIPSFVTRIKILFSISSAICVIIRRRTCVHYD